MEEQAQVVEINEQMFRLAQMVATVFVSESDGALAAYKEQAGPELQRLHTQMKLAVDPNRQMEMARRIEEIGSYGRFLSHINNFFAEVAGLNVPAPAEEPARDNVVQLFK